MLEQPRCSLKVYHTSPKSEENLDQEWFFPESELYLDDEDVKHENHIASNMNTLNLVTKATSDINDQEEGLEKHPDLPARPTTVESDNTADEAEVLISMKAICPTCHFEGGQEWKTFPAESTVKMVYCATHEYMIEGDTATLRELHRTGYLLDVKTISVVLSTNLDAITALHWAAKKGYFWELKYLLDRRVNPCAIDNEEERSQKRAALHYAASGGFAKEVD